MPILTPKLGIKKPLGNETVSRAAFNENYDIIDANAQKIIVQSATAPSNPVVDDLWIDTSTTPHSLKKWNGTAWQKIGAVTWDDISGKPSSFLPSVHGNEAHDPDLALASDLAAHLADTLKHQRTATIVVAASNSSAAGKAAAQYVCDGVSDQVEINNALSALGSTGGKVVLLEGTYIVDASINVPSNCTLEGQGASTVIKIKDALNASINVVQNADQTNGNTNIILRSFKIDGNKANNTFGLQYGVYFRKITYSVIKELFVLSCRSSCIFLISSSNNTVTSNTCQGNSGNGISLSSSSNNTITSNTCQGNSNNGIYLELSCNNNTITSNTCQGNSSNGIYLFSSSNNTITSNTCQGNSGNGISLSSSSNNTITSNTYQGNSNNGIYLYSSSSNTITSNTCLENSQSANATFDNIQINSSASYNNIQNNTCRQGSLTNKPRYGIRINSSDCTGNLATNNDLYSAGATANFSDAGTSTVTTAGNRTT